MPLHWNTHMSCPLFLSWNLPIRSECVGQAQEMIDLANKPIYLQNAPKTTLDAPEGFAKFLPCRGLTLEWDKDENGADDHGGLIVDADDVNAIHFDVGAFMSMLAPFVDTEKLNKLDFTSRAILTMETGGDKTCHSFHNGKFISHQLYVYVSDRDGDETNENIGDDNDNFIPVGYTM